MDRLHELVSLCKLLNDEYGRPPTRDEFKYDAGVSERVICSVGGFNKILQAAGLENKFIKEKKEPRRVKILVLDIELFPMQSYHWGMWDQNIGVDMMIEDWSVACWTAKWYGQEGHIFRSVKGQKDLRDDKKILEEMRDLMDEADVILGQNSKKFDVKKLYYRFIKHRIKPPSRFLQLDTKIISKRIAALSSNALAFMSKEINEKYQKLKHGKFPGFTLFLECLKGNEEAWTEMETYNLYDCLATEEYYSIIAPYDTSINWNVFSHDHQNECFCGSKNFYMHPKKKKITRVGRYALFICEECGKDWYHRDNELTKGKRESMLR